MTDILLGLARRRPVLRPTVPRELALPAASGLLAFSLMTHAALVARLPGTYWVLEDLRVYQFGGRAASHDRPLYTPSFPGHLPFLYTPFAALLFAVVAGVGFAYLKVAMTIVSLAALGCAVWLAFGLAGVRGREQRLAASMAVTAVAIWLDPVSQTLSFGQINLILMVLLLADLGRADRRHGKGSLTGLAAGIKLTPLIFAAYLLCTKRTRAFGMSVAVLVATAGVSIAVLPRQSAQYWLDGKLNSTAHLGTGYGANQSLYGMIQRLTHRGPDMHALWLAAAVAVAVAGLLLAAWAHRRGDELLAVCLAAVTGLLISPVSWNHHWVWVVPAFVWAAARMPRGLSRHWRLAAYGCAAAILLVFADVPKHIHNAPGNPDPRPLANVTGWIWFMPMRGNAGYFWGGTQILIGNLYVLAGLAFLLVAAWYLTATRTRISAPDTRPSPPTREVDHGGWVIQRTLVCWMTHPP